MHILAVLKFNAKERAPPSRLSPLIAVRSSQEVMRRHDDLNQMPPLAAKALGHGVRCG
jgi:hypothetical protein